MPSRHRIFSFMIAAAATIAVLLFLPGQVRAATLYLTPATRSLTVGQTFTAVVEMSSPDQPANAVSGDISFPSDKLRVLSVSQTDSIVNFWVQNPSFSNTQGTGDVVFQGVVLSPGFSGSAGDIVRITFQTIAQGTAPLTFSSGSVLANDGKGTNILTSMSGSSFTVGSAPVPKLPSTGVVKSPPAQTSGVAVTSVPSIENNTWYSVNNVQFNWNMPIGADGVWYAFASSSNAVPSVSASVSQKTSASYDLSSLSDGIWYFLISAEQNGIWSPVVTKTLRLDRTPPEPFTITRTDSDPTNAQMTLSWSTTDALSGLSHYEMKIGNGDWFDPATLQQGSSYVLPQSVPGRRTFAVRAIDNAGNIREENVTFDIVTSNSWEIGWGQIIHALSFAELALIFIALILVIAAYIFIYRILIWKRKLKKELSEFKEELRDEVEKISEDEKKEKGLNIDLRQTTVAKEKKAIEKETKYLEEETEAEIKKIKELNGEK